MTAMRLPGPCSNLSASVDVPASKSLTNRALVAAAVADGGEVDNPLDCEDTRLLANALAAAGWTVEWTDRVRLGPRRSLDDEVSLWLGNSGTGARLVLGLLAATPGRFLVDGTPRLRERPMAPLVEALARLGASVECSDGRLPAAVEGHLLEGGEVVISPRVSSQFVSSLLLAAPLMRRGIVLDVEGELPSRPYVDLTEQVLREFGVEVDRAPSSRRWRVPPGKARPARVTIEGDWSAAAFPAAAAAVVGGSVSVGPLALDSLQGDRAVCDFLRSAGVEVTEVGDRVRFRGPAQRPLIADLRETPDLFPALSVVAATVTGSKLAGLDHLKHKESDRLAVMVANLRRLGCEVEVADAVFCIHRPLPKAHPLPIEVTAADDHRIAMAMAVAALRVVPVDLDDPDCVVKSFPGFWQTWSGMLEGAGPAP